MPNDVIAGTFGLAVAQQGRNSQHNCGSPFEQGCTLFAGGLPKTKLEHHARKQTARHKKSSSQTNDPKPEWFLYDGGSYPEDLEKLSAWEKRHPEGYQEPVRPASSTGMSER